LSSHIIKINNIPRDKKYIFTKTINTDVFSFVDQTDFAYNITTG